MGSLPTPKELFRSRGGQSSRRNGGQSLGRVWCRIPMECGGSTPLLFLSPMLPPTSSSLTTEAKSSAVYCVKGLATKIPALFTSVSTRPKCSSAVATTRSAVVGSEMSPALVTSPSDIDGLIERDVATTR